MCVCVQFNEDKQCFRSLLMDSVIYRVKILSVVCIAQAMAGKPGSLAEALQAFPVGIQACGSGSSSNSRSRGRSSSK